MYASVKTDPEEFVRISVELEFIGQIGSDDDYLYRFYREGKSYVWYSAGYGDIGKKVHLTLYQLKDFTPHNRISDWIINAEERGRHTDIMKHETT